MYIFFDNVPTEYKYYLITPHRCIFESEQHSTNAFAFRPIYANCGE